MARFGYLQEGALRDSLVRAVALAIREYLRRRTEKGDEQTFNDPRKLAVILGVPQGSTKNALRNEIFARHLRSSARLCRCVIAIVTKA